MRPPCPTVGQSLLDILRNFYYMTFDSYIFIYYCIITIETFNALTIFGILRIKFRTFLRKISTSWQA